MMIMRYTTAIAILALGFNFSCFIACASQNAPATNDSPTVTSSPPSTINPAAPNDQPAPAVNDNPDGAFPVEPLAENNGNDIIPLEDPALDKLLDTLETSADDLRCFTARIIYRKYDSLLARKETRTGELIVLSEPVEGAPGAFKRKFAVLFDALVVNERRDQVNKHYIFDGRWLAEIDHERKIYTAREIVPPGRSLDPLKLGEGPFPLPIGQRKIRVLERFMVDWADAPAGLLGELNPDTIHGITLTPRAGSEEASEFKRVDIYYDKIALLPVGIETVEINGDRKTVLLRDLKRNPDLDEAALKKVTIERPNPDEWNIDERKWDG